MTPDPEPKVYAVRAAVADDHDSQVREWYFSTGARRAAFIVLCLAAGIQDIVTYELDTGEGG